MLFRLGHWSTSYKISSKCNKMLANKGFKEYSEFIQLVVGKHLGIHNKVLFKLILPLSNTSSKYIFLMGLIQMPSAHFALFETLEKSPESPPLTMFYALAECFYSGSSSACNSIQKLSHRVLIQFANHSRTPHNIRAHNRCSSPQEYVSGELKTSHFMLPYTYNTNDSASVLA